MEKEKPMGWVMIPPHIMANESLSPLAKLLYGKINGLTGKQGYCWASNKTLAEYLGVKDIRDALESLVNIGVVEREITNKTDRKLYTTLRCRPQPPAVETATPPAVETATTMHLDYALKKEKIFSEENLRPSDIKRLKMMGRASDYVADGNSPNVRLAEKRALEKALGLRKTPEIVRFIYKAGWDFREEFLKAKGFEYEGNVLLDTVAKTLSEWYKRKMNSDDVRSVLVEFFRSKKAKENTVTPTSCFSEHTYQSYVQKTLK